MVYGYKKVDSQSHWGDIMIKTVSLLLLIIGISLVTIYLTRTGKQYVSKKENIVVSFIDFLLTEDIAFEVLFIFLIVFLIVFFA